MEISKGFLKNLGRFLALGAVLGLIGSCAPPSKSDEELRKEVQGLKTEVAALKDKVAQLEAGQKLLMEQVRQPAAAPLPPPGPMALPEQPPASKPVSVSQLIKEKDRFIGARVTVRGAAGPVMMHHQSLFLKGPEGMVEVLFGNLQDKRLVERLTSTPLDQPVTVTGTVNPAPKGGGAKLQITAESVEF